MLVKMKQKSESVKEREGKVEGKYYIHHYFYNSDVSKINLQLKDNVKARSLNKTQSNPYKKSTAKTKVRAQFDFYHFLEDQKSV